MKIQNKLIITVILISGIIISGSVVHSTLVSQVENVGNYHNDMSIPALTILNEIDSDFLRLNLIVNEFLLFGTYQDYEIVKKSLLDNIKQYDELTLTKNSNGDFYANSKMQKMMKNFTNVFNESVKKYDVLFVELISSSEDHRNEILIQINEHHSEIKKSIDADIRMEEEGKINEHKKIIKVSERIQVLSTSLDIIVILLIIIIISVVGKSIKKQQTLIEEQDKLLHEKNQELEEELLEKQKQLLKKERFSAIGELSSRIAHDIRNPLGVIRTSLDNMRIKHDDPEFTKKTIIKCDNAVSRISHQINEVMDFLKDSPLTLEPLEFSNVLKAVLDELEIPEGIKIMYPTNDINILGDKIKIESLIYNLITNAIQKLQNNGIISISISEDSDNMVKILVEDNGSPIPEDMLKKIFDPLFTTKQQGTGLGLASCLKIVQQHSGYISASNNPVTFTIILPQAA